MGPPDPRTTLSNVQGQSEEPGPVQVVKGHAEWKYWTATPADLADIAQTAFDLVGQASPSVSFSAKVSAPAFDASFLNPAQLRDGLRAEDLGQLESITITADGEEGTVAPSRIAFTVVRSVKRAQGEGVKPIVKLSVTGPHRDWVELARLRMSERIARGARPTAMIVNGLLVVILLLAGLAIGVDSAWGDKKDGLNGAEIATVAIIAFGGVLLLIGLLSGFIAPQLELIQEGGLTRWGRIKARSKVSGKWTVDLLVKAAIGALIGILIKDAL